MDNKILNKIKWCISDIDEFIDLIEINNSDVDLIKRYKLAERISGDKIKNRFENLIIACWSARDYIKKQIERDYGKEQVKIFEERIYKHRAVELIQYLADAIKHDGIGDKNLIHNQFKTVFPRLNKIVLIMQNNSVEGNLKPTYVCEGYECLEFDIQKVMFVKNGQTYFNFDTIILTMTIVNQDNKEISNAIGLINRYIVLIEEEFNYIKNLK